jgi:hypothetical protein
MIYLNIKCYITRSNCSLIFAIRIWVYKNARTATMMLLLSVGIFFIVVVCIQNVLNIGQVHQKFKWVESDALMHICASTHFRTHR